jgi:hypothetical protein
MPPGRRSTGCAPHGPAPGPRRGLRTRVKKLGSTVARARLRRAAPRSRDGRPRGNLSGRRAAPGGARRCTGYAASYSTFQKKTSARLQTTSVVHGGRCGNLLRVPRSIPVVLASSSSAKSASITARSRKFGRVIERLVKWEIKASRLASPTHVTNVSPKTRRILSWSSTTPLGPTAPVSTNRAL